MPLREDILNPVSEASPGGENLRYAPVYDKIKEARREDDDAKQGEWQRERKVADHAVVIRLASEAIATRSKDLQLAAWLTEALLKRDGYPGLLDGITLVKNLLETFWDTLWPELDDGDVELRAAPVEWVGRSLVIAAKRVPLTKSGYDYLKYLEAKSVGSEPPEEEYDRREKYNEAIAEGKLSLDQFDKAVASTPKDFYQTALQAIDDCFQVMEDSQPLFEEKFGAEYAPSYRPLRESIEEVRRVVNTVLTAKIAAEAPPPPPPEEEEPPEETPPEDQAQPEAERPPHEKKGQRRVTSVEPADLDDAAARLAAVAAFWRQQDASNPAPYLMLRGMRWGEVRASGDTLDPGLFEPPSTEVRTSLKRLLSEGSYAEVIEMAETAMAEPCGRAWLDLQRYVVTACENLGYTAIAAAIKSELKALLTDLPDLKMSALLDDTPCANAETVRWLDEFASSLPTASPQAVWSDPPPAVTQQQTEPSPETGPDSYELAQQAARSGRIEDAMDILSAEIAQQTSGRGRFERKLQLAQICLAAGQADIARAVLTELADAIDEHRLETWESADLVAHALSLLFSCSDHEPAAKAQLYARICRLSPVQALRHGAQAFAHSR